MILFPSPTCRELNDTLIADHFCNFYGGHVERMDQGIANGDRAVEFLAEIVGSVILAIELKRRGNIVHRRDGCNDGLQIFDGVVECRGIDEGLEHRARLAMSESVIQLALPVAPPANQSANLSCPRIKRDQRHLRSRRRLAGLFPDCVTLGQQLIHLLHPSVNRSCGRALQARIESRIDAVALAL
jgi:hypothetical protein